MTVYYKQNDVTLKPTTRGSGVKQSISISQQQDIRSGL